MPVEQYALIYIAKRYEGMLRQLMDAEEFSRFVTDVAREAFMGEIERMAPSDFKDFCLQNFEKITGAV